MKSLLILIFTLPLIFNSNDALIADIKLSINSQYYYDPNNQLVEPYKSEINAKVANFKEWPLNIDYYLVLLDDSIPEDEEKQFAEDIAITLPRPASTILIIYEYGTLPHNLIIYYGGLVWIKKKKMFNRRLDNCLKKEIDVNQQKAYCMQDNIDWMYYEETKTRIEIIVAMVVCGSLLVFLGYIIITLIRIKYYGLKMNEDES